MNNFVRMYLMTYQGFLKEEFIFREFLNFQRQETIYANQQITSN